MLLNLNHKTLTAEKLILELEKKEKLSTRKKKIINYARHIHCTATYVMKHSWTVCCKVTKFGTVVGTLIQYLLDGDTFIIRIQCCVLEVL